jgi:hypothetical protein
MPRVAQPLPGVPLYVCGEAYSCSQGWVEGALETAEEIVRRVSYRLRPQLVHSERLTRASEDASFT